MYRQMETCSNPIFRQLLLWYLNLPRGYLVNDVVRRLAVDCAANTLRSAEDLLATVGKALGKGF